MLLIKFWPKLKISNPGLCTPNDKRYLKYYWMNILDKIECLLFCLRTFSVRSSVSPSASSPGFGPNFTGAIELEWKLRNYLSLSVFFTGMSGGWKFPDSIAAKVALHSSMVIFFLKTIISFYFEHIVQILWKLEHIDR